MSPYYDVAIAFEPMAMLKEVASALDDLDEMGVMIDYGTLHIDSSGMYFDASIPGGQEKALADYCERSGAVSIDWEAMAEWEAEGLEDP